MYKHKRQVNYNIQFHTAANFKFIPAKNRVSNIQSHDNETLLVHILLPNTHLYIYIYIIYTSYLICKDIVQERFTCIILVRYK